MFAKRTHWELSTNKITTILESLREKGVPIFDLTESNPTRCQFDYLRPDLLEGLSAVQNLRYLPSPKGNLPARETICAYYRTKNIHLDPEQIFLTASTSEAYSFLFRLLADPQESVLFPCPSYPLFSFLVDLNDLKYEFYPLTYESHGWRIDLEGLWESLTPETRAVALVNPNNPTGSFVQESELTQINGICRNRALALISDEVFLDYVFDGEAAPLSLAGNKDVLTFVLSGISKGWGLPQMKLGWIVVNGPRETVKAAAERLEIICDTYLSVNTPVQSALPKWLESRAEIQQEIGERIQRNRNFLFSQSACTCLRSAGGWYAVLKFAKNYTEEALVEELLRKDRVFVHPGYFFDFAEEPYLVLSLLPSEEIFQEGIKRLVRRLG